MATIENVRDLLWLSTRLLDLAAVEIRDLDLDDKRQKVQKIAEAISSASDVKDDLEKRSPSLRDSLLLNMEERKHAQKTLSELILKARVLHSEGKLDAVKQLYGEYVNSDAPPDLKRMAELRLEELSKS